MISTEAGGAGRGEDDDGAGRGVPILPYQQPMLATMSNVSGRMVVVIVVAIVFTGVGGGGNDRFTVCTNSFTRVWARGTRVWAIDV